MHAPRVLLDDGAPHSEDCAFALRSAAALAVSNLPSGPLAITSCDPVTRFSPTADLRCWHAVLREHQRPSDTGPNRGLGRQGKATGAIRRQPFLPYRPIGSCSRSSAALFTRRSRPAHRALDRRSDRGLAWTAHHHFRIAPYEQHTGTTGRLELGLQANIAGETQSPTALAS